MNVTFKKHAKQGRFASFELDQTDIKHRKQCIGTISQKRNPPSPDEAYEVRFTVKDGKSWKWITLKRKFPNEQAARDYLTPARMASVDRVYTIHHLEP